MLRSSETQQRSSDRAEYGARFWSVRFVPVTRWCCRSALFFQRAGAPFTDWRYFHEALAKSADLQVNFFGLIHAARTLMAAIDARAARAPVAGTFFETAPKAKGKPFSPNPWNGT